MFVEVTYSSCLYLHPTTAGDCPPVGVVVLARDGLFQARDNAGRCRHLCPYALGRQGCSGRVVSNSQSSHVCGCGAPTLIPRHKGHSVSDVSMHMVIDINSCIVQCLV